MLEFSKDYEKSGGTFAVSYTTYPEYNDTRYREHTRQQAEHELGYRLYDLLVHTRNPAVVKIDEHDRVIYEPTRQIQTAFTVTVTPVETQHVIMPSYYEPFTPTRPPAVRTAVRYWLSSAYQKAKRNWRAK